MIIRLINKIGRNEIGNPSMKGFLLCRMIKLRI